MIFFFPGCILYPESSGVYQGRVLADLLNLHGFSHPDVLNGIIDVNSLLMSSDPKFGMVPLNDICIIFLNIYIYNTSCSSEIVRLFSGFDTSHKLEVV